MPTTLRSFPQISRSGTQQTPYAQLPSHFEGIHLTGQASAATLSNAANEILFVVLASPTGSDADAVVIGSEQWFGGTRINKNTGLTEPNPIDVAFGLDGRQLDSQIALKATFSQPMTVGALLEGLP